jgi:RimJ/RimL family protein N-acetyltransferase
MQFVDGHEDVIADFISAFNSRDDRVINLRHCKTIGVIDNEGKLIAGIVYHNYDPDAGVIEVTLAATDRRWVTRATLRRGFEFPFIQCNCQMIYTRVRSDNEYLLGMLARLNFSFTLIPRMYGRAEDGVVCTLTDDQWLEIPVVKKIYSTMKLKQLHQLEEAA